MKKYRLAAVDMDGTLLNTAHVTSEGTRAAIEQVSRAGGIVALASGRAMSELVDHLAVNPSIHYVISANGSTVRDLNGNRILYSALIGRDTAEQVLAVAAKYDCIRQLFLDGQSYIDVAWEDSLEPYHMEYFRSVWKTGAVWNRDLIGFYRAGGFLPEKMNLYFAGEEEKAACWEELEKLPVALADSIAVGIEITHPEATKDRGLLQLCEALGISIEDAVAIGDGGNDADMLRAAGLSVAMKNASPNILAIADAVTDDNDHDGAAKAMLKYLL